MLNKILSQFIFLFALAIMVLSIGCGGDKKAESPQTENEKSNQTISETDTANEVIDKTKLEKEIEKIPDITGTWVGKLDAHASTLRITEQDSLNFKGRISTKFRQEINQEVSGKINPGKKTLTMRDILHSRYEGTYSAKFSEDMNSMTGTFTITADHKNVNFSYSKK